jgi:tyrosinase
MPFTTALLQPGLNSHYWDYYKNPRIPSEFTDPATGNPLYQQRVGTNVCNALDLSPFASTVYNLQRGKTNPFETKFESAPHNAVHKGTSKNLWPPSFLWSPSFLQG